MLNKIRKYIYYISMLVGIKDFSRNMDIYGKKQLFDIEKFIQKEDKKRKTKITDSGLAKEMLLYGDCYIIRKDVLKEYINKR